jgi:hypothetical protein
MPISITARFWLYFPVLIPSLVCSVFVLYHLLTDRALRRALNNHVIILILFLGLFYELTDVVWLIHYYRVGNALIQTKAFCLTWSFMDFAGFCTISILVAWASIERHILIFHDKWVSTKWGRLFIHYIPLVIFLLYPIIFYIFIFFITSCELPLDYAMMHCGYSFCALFIPAIGRFDSIVNDIIPTFCIVIFSILLLARVLWQKRRLRQRIQWRNYRKMAVQLLSIASLYFVIDFPPMVLYALYTSGVSISYNAIDYYASSLYFTAHIIMLIPLVTAFSLPELRAKLKMNVQCWRRPARAVVPETIQMRRTLIEGPIVVAHIVK